MKYCEAWYMLDSAALFGSSKWSKICLLYYMFVVALAVVRFYKPAFCTWILVLLKSAATSYISNSILYKNILVLDRNPHVVSPETIEVLTCTTVCWVNYNIRQRKTYNPFNGYQNKNVLNGTVFRKQFKRSIVRIGLNIIDKPSCTLTLSTDK